MKQTDERSIRNTFEVLETLMPFHQGILKSAPQNCTILYEWFFSSFIFSCQGYSKKYKGLLRMS